MDSNSIIVINRAMDNNAVWTEVFVGLVTGGFVVLLAAYLAYKYGLQTYFKQREHEQIMKRYLEEGVDRISASVDHLLSVSDENCWTAECILIDIKLGRKPNVPVTLHKIEQRSMAYTPLYRISNLVGDRIFSLSYLMLLGGVEGITSYIERDFCSIITNVLDNKLKMSNRLQNHLKQRLDEHVDKVRKYHLILDELQFLASILEKEPILHWADLGKFQNRPKVKESVKRLKNKLGTELKNLKGNQKQ